MANNEKELELEDEEVTVPADKVLDTIDPLVDGEIDPEAITDDGELDDTEIDPFKDKWEE